MSRFSHRAVSVAISLAAMLSFSACGPTADARPAQANGDYDDLIEFFGDWREFETPEFIDGAPNYSLGAMAKRHSDLADWQSRLASFDIEAWPVSQQIEWHLIRAEMNGLDFDHRVRRPWVQNPAYYVTIFPAESDVPAHEGPVNAGFIDLWTYDYPLSEQDAAKLAQGIGAIPVFLLQARKNLTGDARDLWLAGLRSFAGQSRNLQDFQEKVRGTSDTLDEAIVAAIEATDSFHQWIDDESDDKEGLSGVGKDNYTWYMRNVHLVPYSWEEQVVLMRRELARAHSSLRLEEHRNRDLPQLERIQTAEEYDRRLNDAVSEYMTFLDEEEIHTIQPWMDPALRASNGTFTPAARGEIRNFFNEVNYRDPMAMRTHMHHWIELARMRENPHASPIRNVPQLYNIFDARSEGLATGMEEMMMHAGLFEGKPRTRELVWIMLAQRAARALSGLMLHGNEFTMEEAVAHSTEWTPRGWLPDADLVRFEQHLYLQQPGYGTSYLTGKIQIEELMSLSALQLGDEFTLKGFFDAYFDAGVIPTELVRWEMTGVRPPLFELIAPQEESP